MDWEAAGLDLIRPLEEILSRDGDLRVTFEQFWLLVRFHSSPLSTCHRCCVPP